MKVYVVSSGCRYEGSSIDGIFASLEKAEAYIKPIEAARQRNARAFRVSEYLRNLAWNKLGGYEYLNTNEIEDRIRRGSYEITCLGDTDFISWREWEVIE